MTAAQRAELPEDEEMTAADRLIVESPTHEGLIVLRALAPETEPWIAARGRAPRLRGSESADVPMTSLPA